MKLRFTRQALRQLDAVLAYIAERNPQGAPQVQAQIQTVTDLLRRYPQAGQVTTRPGIRRVVVVPDPYAVTYRIGPGEIVIRSVRHTARRPLA
ncbi:type II toxin-antitoxin system RelE/ParE family toxin [Methylobacterium dankookense]|uniref:Toxin RelE2 n=1 Tax=Methylobacterium dankookense TaxID=560405 RepID=A0A564FRP2_9HYPH|nr:type II toxin-antitoxin system RelE/ParE family toxin [Methylobacterium dankookense]GJD57206.1 Toxin RelE2 [Methylobacterium dankookense]VUF10825.1 Toxin RelE2 [Methylobacterium dankookense]